MNIMKGKFNIARVMIDLDDATKEQIQGFLNDERFAGNPIAIMPDAHKGMGSCIGFTMPVGKCILPEIIGVDIGCLDKDTEFLTPHGWKPICSYVVGDKVLQYNKETDEALFVTPSHYIVKDCEEFYWFKNSKGLDQMVSEEHKMLIWSGYKSRGYKLKDISPTDLSQLSLEKGYYGIKTTFSISQKGVDFTDDELRLLIAVSADGCVRKEFIGGKHIEFHLRKHRKIDRIISIIKSIGYKYSLTKNRDGTTNINFNCSEKISKSLSILWGANIEQLRLVSEECLLWDGHKGYRSFYSSTIKENADIIQFAFAATGIRAGIFICENTHANWNTCYNVIPTKNNIVGITEYTKQPSLDGKKYCFTVPSGYFIIRRNDKISITGNCGVQARNYGNIDVDLVEFDKHVRNVVPMGFNIHNTPIVDYSGHIPYFVDHDRAIRSIGTLGGGNHFIEAGRDKDNNFWVTVHTGSRKLGLDVAKHHTEVASMLADKYMMRTPCLPQDTGEFFDYMIDMWNACRYALANRNTIHNLIGWNVPIETIDTMHNYIDTNMVIRKGAVDASEGQTLLIPFNMRDGIAICVGKGNAEWNNSAPHGAGRILSRTKAKDSLSVDAFVDTMKNAGVYTTTANAATLDEAPDAYKDKDCIIRAIEPTVDIINYITPVYNCKGGN